MATEIRMGRHAPVGHSASVNLVVSGGAWTGASHAGMGLSRLEVDRAQEGFLVEHALAQRQDERVVVGRSFGKSGHLFGWSVQTEPLVDEFVGDGFVQRRLVERVGGIDSHHERRRVCGGIGTSVRVGAQEDSVPTGRCVEAPRTSPDTSFPAVAEKASTSTPGDVSHQVESRPSR